MEIHYTKHHAAYIKNANKALEGQAALAVMPRRLGIFLGCAGRVAVNHDVVVLVDNGRAIVIEDGLDGIADVAGVGVPGASTPNGVRGPAGGKPGAGILSIPSRAKARIGGDAMPNVDSLAANGGGGAIVGSARSGGDGRAASGGTVGSDGGARAGTAGVDAYWAGRDASFGGTADSALGPDGDTAARPGGEVAIGA